MRSPIDKMSRSLEIDYRDLNTIHRKVSKKLHKYLKQTEGQEFDENHRNLVNAITQLTNAKLGLFRNYKIQKQLDELNHMIDCIPLEVRKQYFLV